MALEREETSKALDQKEKNRLQEPNQSDKVPEKLDRIIYLLEQLLEIVQDKFILASEEEDSLHPLDPRALLNLEDHLRETILVVNRLGRATAEEIGAELGKNRSTANLHLLSLRKLGMIDRERGNVENNEESKKYYWFIV
ncbi:MAG: hypothetical protein ACFFBD_07525 [Candidatus Hodarchaeota archaeon]